jgi:hypothetical protein
LETVLEHATTALDLKPGWNKRNLGHTSSSDGKNSFF